MLLSQILLKLTEEQMNMLGLKETMNQLAKANEV